MIPKSLATVFCLVLQKCLVDEEAILVIEFESVNVG
jgi:hypothetical protein